MQDEIQMHAAVKTHTVFVKRNLVLLVFLFATIFANFCFPVVAYPYNTKSNSSGNLYSSRSAIDSYKNDDNLLTLHNITNKVSFTGEVNVNNLPDLSLSKPAVIADPNEQYLTRNYTAYINAKKQAELIKTTNTPTTNVIEIQRPDLPILVPNFNNGINNKNNANNSFAIINTRFEGLSQVCCIPPDIQVAVGSQHVMETVNSEAAIYTKTGSLIKKFGLEYLFNLPSRESSDSHGITDPVLLFDSTSNDTRSNSHIDGNNNRRWFASISDVTTHSIRIAVSKTNDPTGVWRIYNFPFESLSNNCSDQPFISVSDDKLAIVVNTWSNNCDWSNGLISPKFRGVQFVVADKHDLLAEEKLGHIKAMQSVSNTKYFSLRPALNLSPTTALFLVTTDDFNHDKVQILAIDGKISNLYIDKAISGNIHITNISPDGIQPLTFSTIHNNSNNDNNGQQNEQQEPLATVKEKHPEYLVHTGDARVQSPIWHKGKLWLALNVGCFINGDTQSRSCIRIIEFETNTSKVLLDFNIGHIGASLYYPALSIDKSGNNIGIIFGYSSSDTYPSLLIGAGAAKNNIFNSLKYFQFLKNGTANSLATRYGDYFSAAIDPSEPNSIWVAGQYYYYHPSSSIPVWSTYIGKINTESSRR
jgi:hypothetical protein